MIYNHLRIKALFVRAKGLEPPRLSAPDPKSGLSTNFNTPATVFYCFPFGKDCKGMIKYLICKIIRNRFLNHVSLETESQTDAETHGDVGIDLAKPMPEFKTVMVICFCSISIGISSTEPEICKETAIDILISDST